MPRTPVQPPVECRNAAETALRNYSTPASFPDRVLEARSVWSEPSRAESVKEEDALPVYTLGLDDILERRRLTAVEYAGWQFLQQDIPGRTIGTEVHRAVDGSTHAFAQFNMGPFPAAIQRTLRELDARVEEPRDYEVRILRIPSLHIESLWLSGERDTIVPLEPAPDPLETGRLYPAEEFFVRLEPAALESTRFDNSPQQPVEEW